MRRWLMVLALVGAPPAIARARQEPERSVEARVTTLQGSSIYLDRGSDAGIAVGDRVLFTPADASTVEGVVRAVTKQSARVELVGNATLSDPSARVEVLLAGAPPATAAHPPWTASESWDGSLPLLAPLQAGEARNESEWRGRTYASLDATLDHEAGSRAYLDGRAGARIDAEHPFGWSGALHADFDALVHDVDVDDLGGGGDTILRVQRLSYEWGGRRDEPDHVEVGRFLHGEFPELGLVDGVEFIGRTDGGDRFGGSIGLLPEWTDELSSGDDVGGSVFYRIVRGERESFTLGGAFQKTWHEGEADRDLALLDLDWRPDDRWSLYGTAWVDLYGAGDATKSGAELTQLNASLQRRFGAAGALGVFATRYAWPELLRDDLPPVTASTLDETEVTRVGLDGWRSVTQALRLGGRFHGWSDQDDDGIGGELRIGLRDLLGERTSLDLAVFDDQGKHSSVIGARVRASRYGARGRWHAAYEIAERENEGFVGGQRSLLSHSLRAGVDWTLGEDWDLALFADERFGDQQSATALGFELSRRF